MVELAVVQKYELGWGRTVNFNHDFRGKEALRKIADKGHRVMVSLEWNGDDVVDVWASQFCADEPYETMEQAEDFDPTGQFEYRVAIV